MARSLGPTRRDLLRPLDMLSSVWASAATPVSSGAALAYRTLFVTVKRLIVGRTLTVRLDSGDLTLTITEFDSRLDVRRLAVGQLNDVRVTASDIGWEQRHFDDARLILRNVHVRPGVPPMLVAAPVEITAQMSSQALTDLLGSTFPRVTGHIGEDGVARLAWARRPGLAWIEVDVRVEGATLLAHPRAVHVGRRRWRLPMRVPAYPVALPDLGSGLMLTDLHLGSGTVTLSGSMPEWRAEVPRARVEDVLNQLGAVGRPVNLSRSRRD